MPCIMSEAGEADAICKAIVCDYTVNRNKYIRHECHTAKDCRVQVNSIESMARINDYMKIKYKM